MLLKLPRDYLNAEVEDLAGKQVQFLQDYSLDDEGLRWNREPFGQKERRIIDSKLVGRFQTKNTQIQGHIGRFQVWKWASGYSVGISDNRGQL